MFDRVTESLSQESGCLRQTEGNCFRERVAGNEVKAVSEPWSYL